MMMMKTLIAALAIGAISALTAPPITGPTPAVIDCPNSLCDGKYDGNYEIVYQPNYFVQCLSGLAFCQACWPAHLVFSGKCNQCLYNKRDACATTDTWEPAVTYHCPDKCPQKGPHYSGNMVDPYNPYHYIACWKGVTVGCIACPAKLEFNEEWNACLYAGKYKTEPTSAKHYYPGDLHKNDYYEH